MLEKLKEKEATPKKKRGRKPKVAVNVKGQKKLDVTTKKAKKSAKKPAAKSPPKVSK